MLLSLNSFEKVRDFVNAVTECDTDVNLISGNYMVNAKSIMGIFSLDLSKPVEAVTDESTAASNKELRQIRNILHQFQV